MRWFLVLALAASGCDVGDVGDPTGPENAEKRCLRMARTENYGYDGDRFLKCLAGDVTVGNADAGSRD